VAGRAPLLVVASASFIAVSRRAQVVIVVTCNAGRRKHVLCS